MKELALQVATDPDQKFDLAIQLDDLDMALELARSSSEGGAEPKWRIVGDKALAAWRMDLAQECYEKAGDLSALLLIYSSLGDRDGMRKLANLARKSCWITNARYHAYLPIVEKGQNNVAFNCFFQIGDVASCIDVLIKTGRAPEAALFARTYAPSAVPATVKTWKKSLESSGKQKIAQTLADPEDGDEELFEEGWADAVQREKGGAQSTNVSQATNGEVAPAPYSVKEDGVSSPPANEETSVTEVVEDLVEKAKELIVSDNAEETEAGKFEWRWSTGCVLMDLHFSDTPADETADAEVADEESKPEETADTTPTPPTKSKNKKNKNK